MKIDVIRAWKDEAYRLSLSEAESAALPANPAGIVELNDAALEGIAGGKRRQVAIPPATLGHMAGASGFGGDGLARPVAFPIVTRCICGSPLRPPKEPDPSLAR